MEVIKLGFMHYVVRRIDDGKHWWAGSGPNWSHNYWTRFWRKGAAIKKAERLSGEFSRGGEVIWSSLRPTPSSQTDGELGR